MGEPRDVALRYFDALARQDLDAALACWMPGSLDRMVGMEELVAPHDIRRFFTELFQTMPDFRFEVISATEEEDRCAVRWRARATFSGTGTFQGFEPTGAPIDLEGCDVVHVSEGSIVANHAYVNGATLAQQMGAMPPAGSKSEARMVGLFNRGTRLKHRLGPSAPEPVADGVWVVRGGIPRTMNVYLIEDEGGVVAFDAGIRDMAPGIALGAAAMGGIKRVVLGHAHADHRGAAPRLGAPVWCHPADREDAEGDGGDHYFHLDRLQPHGRFLLSRLLKLWDGGPVPIADTVDEGDEVAGFRVVHLPGHAPGLIGLWRESDRLALASDCVYTLDPQTGIPGRPRVPHAAFNQDTEQARASMRKLAEMEPSAVWPGHAKPLTGDVKSQLLHAAAST